MAVDSLIGGKLHCASQLMLEPAVLKQGARLTTNLERYSNMELENAPQPTMENINGCLDREARRKIAPVET